MPNSLLELESCQPALPAVEWTRLAETPFVFVGAGAVNRPLARHLAWLGMKRCVVVDPKNYKPQSVVSQCMPQDVGKPKAEVVARELEELGVRTTPLVQDIDSTPPGYLEPGSLVALAVDNRRADICANRLALRMRCSLIKVNVEPAYLVSSVRCYNYAADDVPLCLECQMSDEQYLRQEHPLSCDGANEQSTGSPRPLSELAASTAALVIAQVVGSPADWANAWWGNQFQQTLLGGQLTRSKLEPNPQCRCDHDERFQDVVNVKLDESLTLQRLCELADLDGDGVFVHCSGRISTQSICNRCQKTQQEIRWTPALEDSVGECPCGGRFMSHPFFAKSRTPLAQVHTARQRPVSAWGFASHALLALERAERQVAFCFKE